MCKSKNGSISDIKIKTSRKSLLKNIVLSYGLKDIRVNISQYLVTARLQISKSFSILKKKHF